MGDKTGISWTGATWNPIRGCSRVSEGCRNCYAERVAARFSGPGQPYEGLARTSPVKKGVMVYKEPYRNEPRWTGEVRLVPEHLADPLRWKKPRRIFVNSMSDLFHESLTNEQIAAVFGVMAAAPQHTFQILTKRAKRMREWFGWAEQFGVRSAAALAAAPGQPDEWLTVRACALQAEKFQDVRRYEFNGGMRWPLPNVHLGVSVENQDAADERIPELLATPAAVRFLSCEPLLGPVDLAAYLVDDLHRMGRAARMEVDWVIAGSESGPGARHCETAWLRSLRDQCATAGAPYFLKQAVHSPITYGTGGIRLTSLEDITAGPGSKRKPGGVIELPYLDGVQHKGMPDDNR